MKPLALLTVLLLLSIGGVGYLIYQGSQGVDIGEVISIQEEEPEEEPEKTLPPPSPKFLLDSLSAFTAKGEAEPGKKSIGSFTLNFLYSPFSQQAGLSLALNLYGITLGAALTDDVYFSLGYTLTF